MPKTDKAPRKISKDLLKSYCPTKEGSKVLVKNRVNPKNNITPDILMNRTLMLLFTRELLKKSIILLLFNLIPVWRFG